MRFGGVCKEHTKRSSLRTHQSIFYLAAEERTEKAKSGERHWVLLTTCLSAIYIYIAYMIVLIYMFNKRKQRPSSQKRASRWIAVQRDWRARKTAAIDRPTVRIPGTCGLLPLLLLLLHCHHHYHHPSSTMNLRQRIQVWTLLILILFCFASYHKGSGGVGWLQWLTAISIFVFLLVFDLAFTNDSQFIFDPDADNWRRKVVSIVILKEP